ncbi:unnamed protein product, partial [Musa hybrid cultivar]
CPLRTCQSRCLPKYPRSATNSNFISRILWRGMIDNRLLLVQASHTQSKTF